MEFLFRGASTCPVATAKAASISLVRCVREYFSVIRSFKKPIDSSLMSLNCDAFLSLLSRVFCRCSIFVLSLLSLTNSGVRDNSIALVELTSGNLLLNEGILGVGRVSLSGTPLKLLLRRSSSQTFFSTKLSALVINISYKPLVF